MEMARIKIAVAAIGDHHDSGAFEVNVNCPGCSGIATFFVSAERLPTQQRKTCTTCETDFHVWIVPVTFSEPDWQRFFDAYVMDNGDVRWRPKRHAMIAWEPVK